MWPVWCLLETLPEKRGRTRGTRAGRRTVGPGVPEPRAWDGPVVVRHRSGTRKGLKVGTSISTPRNFQRNYHQLSTLDLPGSHVLNQFGDLPSVLLTLSSYRDRPRKKGNHARDERAHTEPGKGPRRSWPRALPLSWSCKSVLSQSRNCRLFLQQNMRVSHSPRCR